MKKMKDGSSLGSILLKLEFVSKHQLHLTLKKQQMYRERAKEELLLGRMLVNEGVISEDQLQEAILMQGKLRGGSKYQNSMAVAELAIQSKKRTQEKIVATTKKITDEHPSIYPDKK